MKRYPTFFEFVNLLVKRVISLVLIGVFVFDRGKFGGALQDNFTYNLLTSGGVLVNKVAKYALTGIDHIFNVSYNNFEYIKFFLGDFIIRLRVSLIKTVGRFDLNFSSKPSRSFLKKLKIFGNYIYHHLLEFDNLTGIIADLGGRHNVIDNFKAAEFKEVLTYIHKEERWGMRKLRRRICRKRYRVTSEVPLFFFKKKFNVNNKARD